MKENYNDIFNDEEILTTIKPTDDFMFKNIFGKQENEDITKDFTSRIINEKITSITLKKSHEISSTSRDLKNCILDIEAVINNNILCNIETC